MRRASTARQRAYYRLRAGVEDAQRRQWSAAKAKLAEALDLDHEFTEARLWLGYVLEAMGDAAAAHRQYEVGLLFAPESYELQQARAGVAGLAATQQTPAGREQAAARSRLMPNLIVAVLLPPTAVVMGVWEIMAARTQQWRDLGVTTLAAGCIAGVFWLSVILAAISHRGPP